MKRFICIVCAVILSFMLCSCNMSAGLGSFTFRKIHICKGDVQKCIEIKKWHDDRTGVEVYSEEYGALFFAEGTYILIGDKCPICD